MNASGTRVALDEQCRKTNSCQCYLEARLSADEIGKADVGRYSARHHNPFPIHGQHNLRAHAHFGRRSYINASKADQRGIGFGELASSQGASVLLGPSRHK